MSTAIAEEDLALGMELSKKWSGLPFDLATAIAQALADRAATAHTEGRREAFGEALDAVATVYMDFVGHPAVAAHESRGGRFALHRTEVAIRSARDRGMAGK